MGYQKIKGTQDFIGERALSLASIRDRLVAGAERFGYLPIMTPLFEATEVFVRGVGEGTDVVTKEMYTFEDKGGRSITLRPEGTAAVVRAVVENKLYALPGLKKYCYFGPMFRYERPQAGRFREFHQFGVEAFGEITPACDVDVIACAWEGLKSLGITDMVLKINTIGDFASREAYSAALREYFTPHEAELCEDCRNRLAKNPLRILDCKVDGDSALVRNAPAIASSLSSEAKSYFAEVKDGLTALGIPFVIDPTLVRGLDYYTGCVFEIQSTHEDALKGLALGGGGKYSGLMKSLGGPDVPGIGYALGIERIMTARELLARPALATPARPLVIASLDPASRTHALVLARDLRAAGFTVELDYSATSLKPQFRLAERLGAQRLIIIGEAERDSATVTLKDLTTGMQETVREADLVKTLREGK